MIAPAKREVRAGGETVTVGEIRVGHIPAAIRAARAVTAALSEEEGGIFLRGLAVAERLPEITPLLSAVTGKDEAFIQGLTIDELLTLAGAAIEVNADFFVRRVLPEATRILRAATLLIGRPASRP